MIGNDHYRHDRAMTRNVRSFLRGENMVNRFHGKTNTLSFLIEEVDRKEVGL